MFFWMKVKVGNLTMNIPRDMAWCFADNEYYEKNLVYWFDKIVSDYYIKPVIYDIGANCGYFTVRYSNCSKWIYSFEPASRTYAVLDKNLRKNKLSNTVAFKVGVSNKSDAVYMYRYSSSGNNSLFMRNLPSGHPLKLIGRETVQLVVLDDFIKTGDLLIPDIMKIDVEGAEIFVLKGAKETISLYRPTILLECGECTCHDAGYEIEDLLNELRSHNYSVFGLTNDSGDMNIYPENEFTKKEICNIIAVPEGMHFG